jgi:hypothetical protein
MPFTPAHIAAVLPLRKRWNLVWSALIIGSMAPDFEYFLTLGPKSHRFHQFPGIVIYTLPLSFFILWVTHRFLKGPVLEFLPTGIAERMDPAPFRFRGLAHIALILLSLSIGIATHLAWDSFTHESTIVTERLPVEHSNVPLPVVGPKKMYKVLQFGSSAVGLALLSAYFWIWYSRTKPRHTLAPAHSATAKIAFWVLTSLAAIAFGLYHAFVQLAADELPLRVAIVITIVSAMAVFFWEVLTFSVLVQVRRRWMMNTRTVKSTGEPTSTRW